MKVVVVQRQRTDLGLGAADQPKGEDGEGGPKWAKANWAAARS